MVWLALEKFMPIAEKRQKSGDDEAGIGHHSRMRIPPALQPLLDDGIIDEVIRPLKSGKEAAVYVVACGAEIRCAKVYKAANERGFQRLAEYQEGRRARGSRDTRAMNRRSKFGRERQETAWKSAEVDALYRLDAAGVRVPKPLGFFDGVLIMELVVDAEGRAAPRLNDVTPTLDEAARWHAFLLQQVVRMLCVGLIHGDLSEFNVLIGPDGPVIIDLPQAVDAVGNNNAFRMLARDVDNVTRCFVDLVPALGKGRYAEEIWAMFKAGTLRPDTVLTGKFVREESMADVRDIMLHIEEARREQEIREAGRARAAREDG
jgi:RIO kinase 1